MTLSIGFWQLVIFLIVLLVFAVPVLFIYFLHSHRKKYD